MQTGPTGRFPDGKNDPNDFGELRIAVYMEDGYVWIDFGVPIQTFSMDRAKAMIFANTLIELAKGLKDGQGS